MNKVLFLDIDGVLNNKPFLEKVSSGTELDPRNIMYFNHIITQTKCKVVVSSAWRLYHTWNNLLTILSMQGVDTRTFIGVTEDSKNIMNRGEEIHNYLIYHYLAEIKIDNFVILDDERDHLVGFPNQEKIVYTDFKVGLTKEKAELAIHILGS